MSALHSKVNSIPAGFLLLVAALVPAPAQAEDSAQERSTESSITPPELSRFVEADLGPDAVPRQESITVLLELTVQADGSTADVVVVRGASPEFDAAALTAVRAFRFSPARRGDEAVPVRIQYEYVFEPTVEPEPTPEEAAEPSNPEAPTTPSQPDVAVASGALRGKLIESGTRKPVIGATVSLPELGLTALTDGEGTFSFEHVPAGKVRIVIEDPEHEKVDDHETVGKDQLTEVSYHVDQTGFGEDDLVAVGQKAKKEVSRHALSVREIETAPGTNGDALKAVQNLPGVARTNGDQLILRGGGDSKVFVNGLPLPAAFHFFGLRSTVGSGLLESIELTPGNYSARYGRANGGVVDIGLRRPKDDGLHGFGQVDLFDASAMIEGPVGEKGSFALGARRSYIDAVLPLLLDEDGKRMFPAAPRYYDYQAAYDLKDEGTRFRAYVLGSSDTMALLFDEPVESDPSIRGDVGYSAEWVSPQVLFEHPVGDDLRHAASASYLTGSFSQSIGRDLKLGYTPHLFALRDEWTHETSDWLTLRGGLDIAVDHFEFDVALPAPPKEGQVPGPLSSQEILRAEGSVTKTNPAAWLAAEIQAGPVLMIPSLRVDHYSGPDELEGTVAIQPRFDTRWAATKHTTLKGGVGFYSEGTEIDETHAVFGNPNAEPDLSVHYSAGVEQRLSDALSLDVTGFYKHLYNRLSPVDDPAVKYENTGKGRAYGAETMLRHDLRSRFYGWLAYTVMRSERLDPGASDYRLFDTDQTHNVTAVGQYRLTPTWEIGARFRFVSGNPTTPVVGATYDSDADIYVPVYGAHNSERVDAFHQLDVRVDKHFVFDAWKLTAYLDVQNVYNHASAEGVSYNYDYSESRPASGLPLIPSFGVKGEF